MAALPAPEMELASAFSRLSPEEKGPIPNFNAELHEVLLQFSESYIGKIANCTSCDSELVALKEPVYIRWLEKKEQVLEMMRDYWSYREDLTIQGGVSHRITI